MRRASCFFARSRRGMRCLISRARAGTVPDVSYGYRNPRFGGRDSGRDWREADWRSLADDPRVPAAENAIGWLLDRGILETVGLAPDGELLLRLSDRSGAESERPSQAETIQSAPAPRSRPRQRRRSGSVPKDTAPDAD